MKNIFSRAKTIGFQNNVGEPGVISEHPIHILEKPTEARGNRMFNLLGQAVSEFGLRRQAQRDAALERRAAEFASGKAPSPLRSAGAVQMAARYNQPHGDFIAYTTSSVCLLLAAFLTAGTLASCSKGGGDADDKPKAEAAADRKPDAPADAGVTIDADTQARLGIATASPTAADWQPEIKAYGQVLDRAPLSDALLELNRAEIALDSSRVELDRAKALQSQNNISQRAFQDIDTTYRQNLSAAQAAYLKIRQTWGPEIASLTGDLIPSTGSERKPDPRLAALTDGSSLVRVDLPAGERLPELKGAVRLIPFAEVVSPVNGLCFDRLPVMDPQTQQQSVLCVVEGAAAQKLTPGEAVTAYIKTPGNPVSGMVVPASAILRYQGANWVYVQTGTNRFSRAAITLDKSADNGWFVADGLAVTNHIVVTGAQSVLSAELSGNGFNTGQRD